MNFASDYGSKTKSLETNQFLLLLDRISESLNQPLKILHFF